MFDSSTFIGDNPNVLYQFGFGLNYTTKVEDQPDPDVTDDGMLYDDVPLPADDDDDDVLTTTNTDPNDTSPPSQPGTPYLTKVSSTSIIF